MQEYLYLAKDSNGRTLRGEVFSNSEESLVRTLHNKDLSIIRIDLIKPKPLWDKLFQPVKQELLVLEFRQLAAMISSGITITRTLRAITSDDGLPHRFRKALLQITSSVESGYSLSQALRLFPEFFSQFMIGSIEIGETSGRLAETLENCANHLEKEYVYNLKLKQALIYPTVLLSCLGLLMTFCFTYMIPLFLDLFSGINLELPWPTKMLMTASEMLNAYGPTVFWTSIGPVVFFIWAMNKWLHTKAGRWSLESFILKIPWYGGQSRLRMQSRYFRSLSTLMRSSIPLMTSLHVLSRSLDHEMLRATANFQIATIRDGGNLTSGLRRSGVFQPMALELIRVGEETGDVAPLLEHLADYLDEEMSQGLQLMSKLIEPVILGILGIGVAFVLLAAFLPIYSLAQSFG